MIRRTVALLTLLLLVLPAASVWPLGVGNIELGSALNEPLSARIPLRSLEVGDVEGMRVNLGTPEQFQRIGIERPYFLTQLKFEVVPSADGAYIRVTSEKPVSEPFLNFLLEVSWPRGRVVREYTVLLDPPVYGAAISSTVRQTVPTVSAAPPAAETPSTSASTDTGTLESATTPTTSTATTPASPAPAGGEYGPVGATDTLWSLAERFRPQGGYSVQQTMLAILKANPQAFSHANVNTLRAGTVLRIPSADEVAAISKAEALAEVKRQHSEWQEIRASIGMAPPKAAPEGTMGAAPETAPAPAAQPEAPTVPATQASEAESRLELVGAGSDATGTVGAPEQATTLEGLRRDLNLALEEVEASRRQTAELGARLSDAEALIDDLRRLVELKDESIAALQQQLAAAESAKGQPGETTSVQPDEAAPVQPEATTSVPPLEPPAPEIAAPAPAANVPEPGPATVPEATPPAMPEPAAPAPAPVVKPKVPLPPPPPPQPTSFMEILLEVLPVDPLLLAGGVGGLALIGVGVAVVRRRRKTAAESASGVDERTDSSLNQFAVTELPSTDDDATEVPARVATDTVVGDMGDADRTELADDTRPAPSRTVREEEDPLAEVNNYLAYEHFDQAEELVRRAIEQHPDRHEYRLRLLDVLRQARNVAGFATAATALRDAVGDDNPLMESATAWWSELAPGRPLFDAGEQTVAADDDFTQTHVGMRDEEIFDVTGTADAGTSSVDFDLGFEMTTGGDTTELSEPAGETTSGVDFDLGEGGETAEQAGSSELDFDIGMGEESAPQPEDDAASEHPEGISTAESDLAPAAGSEERVDQDAETVAAASDDLDFDLGGGFDEPLDSEGETVAGAAEDLDFDLGTGADDAAAPAAETDSSALDELDFDLGDEGATDAGQDTGATVESSLDAELDAAAADALDLSLGDETAQESSATGADDLESTAGTEQESTLEDDFDLGLSSGEEEITLESEQGSSSADDLEAPADDDMLDLSLDADAADEAQGTDALVDDFALDLSEDGDAASVTDSATGEADELDFDLGGIGDDAAASGDEHETSDTVLDLDFGADADRPRDDETADVDASDALDLDLGDFDTDTDADAGAEPATDAVDDGEALDLGFGDDEATREIPPSELGNESVVLDDAMFDTVKLSTPIPGAESGQTEETTAQVSARDEDANLVEAAVEKLDSELDFDIDAEDGIDLGDDFSFDLDDAANSLEDGPEDTDDKTLVLGRGAGGELDEAQTKLDLAQAYIDMGDSENARAILGEVMAEGSEAQIAEAKALLARI